MDACNDMRATHDIEHAHERKSMLLFTSCDIVAVAAAFFGFLVAALVAVLAYVLRENIR